MLALAGQGCHSDRKDHKDQEYRGLHSFQITVDVGFVFPSLAKGIWEDGVGRASVETSLTENAPLRETCKSPVDMEKLRSLAQEQICDNNPYDFYRPHPCPNATAAVECDEYRFLLSVSYRGKLRPDIFEAVKSVSLLSSTNLASWTWDSRGSRADMRRWQDVLFGKSEGEHMPRVLLP